VILKYKFHFLVSNNILASRHHHFTVLTELIAAASTITIIFITFWNRWFGSTVEYTSYRELNLNSG